jgi:serine/threonine protein kinase
MPFQIYWSQKLGEGGEGIVFRGVFNGRPCAVKVPQGHELGRFDPRLRAQLADALRPELSRVLQATGTHLIELLGYNLEPSNDVPFLVYELAEGGSLQDEIDALSRMNQRMTLPLIAARLDDLLVALVQLHEKGLIHRDIKPSNFLRVASGTYKLADLGLGRSLDRPCDAQTVFFRGTPAYAAPEQIERQCFSVGADLFAVGGVAWAMLTNAPPLRSRPLPRLITVRPDAVLLESLIMRLLANESETRPASARAALDELRALRRLIGLPVTVCVRCRRPCTTPPCRNCGQVHH